MSGHDDDSRDDKFQDAVKGVRPLKQDKVLPKPRRPKPIPQQTLRDERAVIENLLSDDYDPADIETGEELVFMRPGLQHTVFRKFRRGHFTIEAELDLHGRIVVEAREMVNTFLREARAQGKRCVRIVHGKGLSSAGKLPVLKGKVNSWLRQRDEVLAFCSARHYDGGTGAVYVLLKRG